MDGKCQEFKPEKYALGLSRHTVKKEYNNPVLK